MRIALCMLAAVLFAASGCDSTLVPRENLTPGDVVGTYVGSAEIADGLASRFTMTLTPTAGVTSGTAASATAGNLDIEGLLLHNSIAYAMTGSGVFEYPSVSLAAKAPSFGDDGFSFALTADASWTVLQGAASAKLVVGDACADLITTTQPDIAASCAREIVATERKPSPRSASSTLV